ncbi:MAG: ABC transporter permease, partial [Clostridiales bacterium]|nr:ABC transporter permease [Clostridiales bacterium]
SFSGYGAADYLFLLLIIITTVLLMISTVSLISAYAKTTKEAASLVSPLMIVIIFVSMVGLRGGAENSTALYLIPFYNSVQSMVGIFSYSYSGVNVMICSISNMIYSLVLVFAVAKMFNNEKIMFSK